MNKKIITRLIVGGLVQKIGHKVKTNMLKYLYN